ncbi:5-oxoprolinase/urea amidolyase family protein [Lentzea tibetensis]|uniref:5-oxoprolinase/urea amidolyase family protein n=1 Tax=Lentzea tibetensis TaxID=2591470 RepID=A0A563EX89_9PSEU|nr:5-oxoprolinase/urea amidolyase family protein [Lentzea tibetensis]TWP52279.1 5-oxoprolinase/urea amidolyase family protein [Lentzea tibetensis]
MFDTLLVANRGEIAVRIIRTARLLGLRTVAVFSDADRGAPHVHLADSAVHLGPAPARDSYLRIDRLLEAMDSSGAGAVHPGYGFLSEDAAFARAVEGAGLVFVGPSPAHLELFGTKHTARAAALAAGVPLLPGTGLLASVDEALAEAERIGYPVMLKATDGGGGVGMRRCADASALAEAWESVRRVSRAGVYLERLMADARHVEVQVFGDGHGDVVVLGDRDCTLQRRNQKVVEECPAPDLPVRAELHEAARALCAAASYRSAGTVEFIYDGSVAAFLEVNTRLQVEHPVTEAVYGVDLVEWMLRLALGSPLPEVPAPRGHAVEARIYAEDPVLDHRPSAGVLTGVSFPDVRVDTWVGAGTEVTTHYDPLLAKVIVSGADRAAAWEALGDALKATRIDGIATNLGQLRAVAPGSRVLPPDPSPRIDVLRAGTMTTVQDWPGRTGYWHVGVPPSGPMDDRSFRLGNQIVGNPEGAPGLECTVDGPSLRFSTAATVCVAGAPAPVLLDDVPVPQWEAVEVPAGSVLSIGAATAGLRTYVLIAGGLDVPDYLGSAATFTLGGFGGHGGRALRGGDVLRPGSASGVPSTVLEVPEFPSSWEIGAVEGPHAAPEFFTVEDVEEFYAAEWQVHFNSARTGVRLVGPRPSWARSDGGEAGLHPSNIHDTPYSVGAVDYTGDLPILLGPDGPSLGGFVCPATVHTAERWKLGQLRPGDTVRFKPVTTALRDRRAHVDGGVLDRFDDVTFRRSGDDNLLVEFGPMQLDLALRMRVHALASELTSLGITGLTPGIRSLQIQAPPEEVLDVVRSAAAALPDDPVVPSRTVHLPLSWDDPATREAIERYMAGVRDDAPWCPWNIEFIRRVNGLSSVDDVYRTVFDAEYLVLGLGDVYLGAPVATPLDPRHRLVTTKYNPARTWTAENSVGIGGAYLCVYGMEGPGGYQFVGRTTQVWHSWRSGDPWLLRFFDRIRWYPVSAEELLDLRADSAAGRWEFASEPGEFRLSSYQRFLDSNAESIAAFRARQAAAFSAERAAWEAAGEFDPRPDPGLSTVERKPVLPGDVVEAPFLATVWRVDVRPGDVVRAGDPLLALEAMKAESVVPAPRDGEVVEVLAGPGDQVGPGTPLVVMA